jgi:quinol monooxygenase YgiN
MVTKGLLVRLEAKPEKDDEVERFLESAIGPVMAETGTTAWFALKMGHHEYGIFDASPDEAGRQAHLSGQVAAALMARAPELLMSPPKIEQVDVLASKLPA